MSGPVWKASLEETDGQKDGEMKDRSLRREHNFQMTAVTVVLLSVFLIAQGHLDYPRTEDICSVAKQWSTQGPAA